MKNLRLYSILLISFFLFSTADLFAQKHHKNQEKARKEYYKKQEKRRKHVQNKSKNHRNHPSYSKVKWRNGPPSWAPAHGYRARNHVYFQDYYTFYDPYRGGYVYRHKNKWLFSRSVPSFLVGVNLNRARVQMLTDVPLNRHPEQYYSRYSTQYPRDSRVQVNISLF